MKDSTVLRIPYAGGSNFPITLTKTSTDESLIVGLPYHNAQLLSDPVAISSYLGVANETNQNLTASQKELLLWY
jgi:hypothetical protein